MAELVPLSTRFMMRLLADGVPPSLLCDLLDPDGLRTALASELLAGDVAASPAPAWPAADQIAETA